MLRTATNSKPSGVMSVSDFCERFDVSRQTVWRYRKNGWLVVTYIGRKPIITAEELARFESRAAKGEFKSNFAPAQ